MTNNLYTLLKADEKQARKIITKILQENGYEPVIEKDFIYAEGTIPVLLVAHYDTVPNPPKWINNDKGILSAKKGLGADDRAGVYAILELIVKHHVSVLFTGGEESGGIGARAFVKSGINPPVNYAIQLDRRGSNDAVYYDGDNKEFEKFITSHGWETAEGSFTDICTICPELGIAGVNLSIGYQHEHTHKEVLDTAVLNKNISRIPELLNGEKYEWVERKYSYSKYGYSSFDYYRDYYAGYFDEMDMLITYLDENREEQEEFLSGYTEEDIMYTFFLNHPTVCFNDVIDMIM